MPEPSNWDRAIAGYRVKRNEGMSSVQALGDTMIAHMDGGDFQTAHRLAPILQALCMARAHVQITQAEEIQV